MAVLYISEYTDAPVYLGQTIPVGMEPAITDQTPLAVGAETKSALFNAKTTFIRVHTDAICSIAFGMAPTATTSNKRLAANQTEYFGVPPGGLYKLSVISNT